jgi:hypothetical protein
LVEIPASHRITLEVPPEIPTGKTIITFTPAPKPGSNPRTAEEALTMAEERAADPNRKPIPRHFGKHKGILTVMASLTKWLYVMNGTNLVFDICAVINLLSDILGIVNPREYDKNIPAVFMIGLKRLSKT